MPVSRHLVAEEWTMIVKERNIDIHRFQ